MITNNFSQQITQPAHHLLQNPTWGQLKSHFGWTPHDIDVADMSAQILFRDLPGKNLPLLGQALGFTIAYIPKGPAIAWHNKAQCQTFFAAVHALAQKQRAIFLKVEPDLWCVDKPSRDSAAQAASAFLSQAGFSPADTIQPQSSIIIDISPNEETILAAMKQKTRYNIRLARKKGVTIRQGSAADIDSFYQLARLTAERDGFGVHQPDYYHLAYKLFAPQHCTLLFADYEGQALAALIAFQQGTTAYYFYGASANTHRNLMPTYLLQWEAIRWAKQQECSHYDLWGIPNADENTLEAEFMQRHDGLWGVYRFKRGFGGQVFKSIGAYDYVYQQTLYKLYKMRRGL